MKTAKQYAAEVRELRAAGFDFPASRGYKLANPSQWSTGQKSAVTRAFNKLETEADEDEEEQITADQFGPDQIFEDEDDTEFDTDFFDDSAGDDFEEWDDIEYFDFDEGEEFIDEESDSYTEPQ